MDTSGDKLYLSEVFAITPEYGNVLYLTTHAFDILFEGNNYLHAPARRTSADQKSDMSVGAITLTLPKILPWIDPSKLRNRYLDNARIKVTWIDRTDHTNKRVSFKGVSGEVSYNNTIVDISFKNQFNVFQKNLPARKYTEGCGHKIYDGMCKLIKASFTEAGTVEAGSTVERIIDSARIEADNYFDLGFIEFTSGLNIGEERWIKRYTIGHVGGGWIDMYGDLLFTPQVGDTYNIVPHCGKTFVSCDGVYGNKLNFGGFEDIPDPNEVLV